MTNATTPRRKLPLESFTECWYVPGETSIVDLIHPDDGLTLHAHENAAQIHARYPSVQRLAFEDAWKLADAAGTARYRHDVTEVTEAQFNDALNVLPPVGWTTRSGVESFRISERLWGNLTDIYARLSDRYFKLVDDIRLSPDIVADRVQGFVTAHPVVHDAEPVRPVADTASTSVAKAPKPGGDA